MIKVDLIQKKLINHLVDYVRNSLIPANLLKSIINLWVMLRVLKIIRPKKSQVVFLQTKKNEKICKKFKRCC